MSQEEDWINAMGSEDLLTRIDGRTNVLRLLFPKDGKGDIKRDIYFGLSDDVRENPDTAIEYLKSLSDSPEEQAYAIWASNWGLTPYLPHKNRGPSLPEQRKSRKALINYLESLAPRFEYLKGNDVKVKVAEIVATEGRLDPALTSLEAIALVGMGGWLYTSLYEYWNTKYGWQVVENIANTTSRVSVAYRALDILAKAPDEAYRASRDSKKIVLEHMICSDDPRIAIKAVNLLVSQAEEKDRGDKVSLATDAIIAGIRTKEGDKIKTIKSAQQPAVEYAFDLCMDFLEEDKRILKAANYLEESFSSWLSRGRGQSFPPGLFERTMGYLESHILEIEKIRDIEKRARTFYNLAWRGSSEEIRIAGVDGLANKLDRKESLDAIAQLVSEEEQLQLNEDAKKKVRKWACSFVRDFASLENKKLARKALGMLARNPNPTEDEMAHGSYEHYSDQCPGYDVKLEGEKEPVHKIAVEELGKIPSEGNERKTDLLAAIS